MFICDNISSMLCLSMYIILYIYATSMFFSGHLLCIYIYMAESCGHPCLSLNSFGWCKDVLTCNSLQVDIHLLSIIIFSQSLAARRYSFCVHFLIIFLRLFDIDQVIVALSHHYRSVNEVICHGIPDARYMFSVFYFLPVQFWVLK